MSSWPILCLIIFFVCPIVWADEVYDLDKIEILAWKDFQQFNLGDSTKLTSEHYPHSSLRSISVLLRDVPGLILSQDGGPGGRTSVFMRGVESRHVVFTLDGLKINDVSNVDRQFDLAFFTTPLIKEIVIYKGPQAVMLGSDAMGGAIELITHKGEKAPLTTVQVMGGSFGTVDSSLRRDWATKAGKSKGSLVLHQMRTDGISRLNQKRFHAKEADSASVLQVSSSSGHQWSEKTHSDLLINFIRGHNELDGSKTDNSYDKSQNDQYILQQKTHFKLSPHHRLSLRNGINRHQRFVDTLLQGQDSINGSNIENEFLFRQKVSNQDYLMGLASQHEEFKLEKIERGFDVHAFFLQSSFQFETLKLQAGLRSEQHQKYGDFQTGSAGFLYRKNFHEFGFQSSQGYKAPSLYQLYAPEIAGDPIGNQGLKPEKNNSLEARWEYWDSRLGGGVNIFQNNLFDLITYVKGQGYLNQSEFTAQGVELNGKVVLREILCRASYAFQDFKENQEVVLRRPRQNWLVSIVHTFTEKWEFETKFKWYSHRYDLDPDGKETKLNSFETVDFGIRYFFKKVSLGLRVSNLFSRDYEELYGYSVMPRAYFFELNSEI